MLQAFQIINGSQERAKELTASGVFNSLLPAVNGFEAVDNGNADQVNDEVLAAQKALMGSEKNEEVENGNKLTATSALAEKDNDLYPPTEQPTEQPTEDQPVSDGFVSAQVTRYGYEGDPYQSKRATSAGSKYENIGNRNNTLESGVSVALPPKTAKKLGINPKAGDFVEAHIGGAWQKFRVDDTTADHKNDRIDFFDPYGDRVDLDGSQVNLRKFNNRQ